MAWRPGADEALFCIAILARDADGIVRPEETDYIANRLAPGLTRLGPEGQMAVVGALAVCLKSQGTDLTLSLLRAALRRDQLPEAVELAIEVSLADRHLDQREAENVSRLAAAFGIERANLVRLLDAADTRVDPGARAVIFSGGGPSHA